MSQLTKNQKIIFAEKISNEQLCALHEIQSQLLSYFLPLTRSDSCLATRTEWSDQNNSKIKAYSQKFFLRLRLASVIKPELRLFFG